MKTLTPHIRKLQGAKGQVITEKYTKGWLPHPNTTWQAWTIKNEKFVNVGEPFTVTGAEVSAEMDAAHSIKGHEPCCIAKRKARELYPDSDIRGVDEIHKKA